MQRYLILIFALSIFFICSLVTGCISPTGTPATAMKEPPHPVAPETTTSTISPGQDQLQPSSGNGGLRIFSDREFSFKYPAEYSIPASEQERDIALNIFQGSWDYSYADTLGDKFLGAFENSNHSKRLDVLYGGQGITSEGYYNHVRNRIALAKNDYEQTGVSNYTYASVTRISTSEDVNAVVLESKILNKTAPIVPFHASKEGGKVLMYVIITGKNNYVLRFSYDDYRTADSDTSVRTEIINSVKLPG